MIEIIFFFIALFVIAYQRIKNRKCYVCGGKEMLVYVPFSPGALCVDHYLEYRRLK